MFKWAGLISLVLGIATVGSARGDFLVNGYGYPGPVNDVYGFYAFNDGDNRTGSRAASADVTLVNVNPGTGQIGHGFVIKFQGDPAVAAADLTGGYLYQQSGDNPAVLFDGRSDRTLTNLLGDEPTADPTLFDVTLTNPPNFHVNFIRPLYQLEQAGSVVGGVDASAAANDGRGALIAVAVVQHGDPALIFGSIQGTTGSSVRFMVQNPEPSSAALMALSLGGLLLARGRMQHNRR